MNDKDRTTDRWHTAERPRAGTAAHQPTTGTTTADPDAVHDATPRPERTAGTAGRFSPSSDAPADAPGRGWSVSIFGDITGTGVSPRQGRATPVSLFGDIDLDVRHATSPGGDVAITAVTPFGNIDIVAAEGVELDVSGFTVFGSKKIARTRPASTGAPVVRVRAFSLFGSIKVWSA